MRGFYRQPKDTTMQTITCRDLETFLDTIQGLVSRGLTFNASAHDLSITLLGGY